MARRLSRLVLVRRSTDLDRLGELQDELRQRERRIRDLKIGACHDPMCVR